MPFIKYTKKERIESELNRVKTKLAYEVRRLKAIQSTIEGLEYRIEQLNKEMEDMEI